MKIQQEEHYIAYFDILGYKEWMQKKKEDSDFFLKKLLQGFSQVQQSCTDTNLVTRLGNINIKTKMFSDNIAICMEKTDAQNEPLRLLFFLNIICDFQAGLFLSHNLLVRGAITKDTVLLVEDTIQGRGIVKVTELESKYANTPRVILDKELYEYCIHLMEKNNRCSYWLKSIVVDESEDFPYLNYLYPQGSILDCSPEFRNPIVQKRLINEMKARDPLLAQKIEQALPRQYDTQGKFAVHKQQLMNGVNEFFNYSGIKCSEAAKRRESIIKKYLWVIDYHNMCCRRYQYPAGIIEYTNSIDATFNTSLPVLK